MMQDNNDRQAIIDKRKNGERTLFDILEEIKSERQKQDSKWGEQNHATLKWNAILGEEVGEVAKSILEGDLKNYREELIQVAAVAVAAIESLDRNLMK